MKHILFALLLAVFGLALSASAGSSDVKVSQEELNALEELLKGTELEDEELTDDDFDDSDDVSTQPQRRIWNPFSWLLNQFKNKCICEEKKCDCCFKLALLGTKACLTTEQLVEEKQIQVKFTLGDKSMVNKNFDLERKTNVCGNVPVLALSFLKFCFNQESEVDDAGVITSCSNIEFKVGSTPGAVIQFNCVEIKDGQITFGGHKELEKSKMLVLKAKSPFKAAVELYKKASSKN